MAYDRRQSEVAVPREGTGTYRDYRLEIGRTEVPVGVSRTFQLLDPDRAAILRGWVDCLIPARGERPSAEAVGAAEYVDASVTGAPALREALLRAIDRLRAIAGSAGGMDFATASLDARTDAVRTFEAEDRSGAFDMVRDFTYEAYYAHPVVLAVLQGELGWDGVAPTRGSRMEPFDEGLLARVRTLPPRYRVVG